MPSWHRTRLGFASLPYTEKDEVAEPANPKAMFFSLLLDAKQTIPLSAEASSYWAHHQHDIIRLRSHAQQILP